MAGRSYPYIGQISDPAARDSLRLLWDKFFSLEASVTSSQSEIAANATAITSLQTDVTKVQNISKLALSKIITTTNPSGGGGGTTPVDDGGLGALGCANAGATGHVDPALPLTPQTAGMVICGTGQEYASLLAIAVDQPTRDANREELLMRMCWHMNLAGFPCGRYGTPAGYPWILLFNVGTTQYAYRVLDYSASDFTIPYTTTMVFGGLTLNAATTPEAGISD